jgi:hypothetical protein
MHREQEVEGGQSGHIIAHRTMDVARSGYSLVGGSIGSFVRSLPAGMSSGEWFANVMGIEAKRLAFNVTANDIRAILANESCLRNSDDVTVVAAGRGVLIHSTKSRALISSIMADGRAWHVLNAGREYWNLRSFTQRDNSAFHCPRGEMPCSSIAACRPPPLGSVGRELELNGSAGLGIGVLQMRSVQSLSTCGNPSDRGAAAAGGAAAAVSSGVNDNDVALEVAVRLSTGKRKRASKETMSSMTVEEKKDRARLLAKARQKELRKRRKLQRDAETNQPAAGDDDDNSGEH